MGYSIAWVAAKNVPLKKILECLRLESTDEAGIYAKEAYAGHELPDGWYLIVGKGCNSSAIASSGLAAISPSGEVVACSIEEHVMVSSAELWQLGRRIWRVEHAAERATSDIRTSGSPPPRLSALVLAASESLEREPRSVHGHAIDYHFSVPLQLARELTGFMHDEEHPSLNYDAFSVFKSSGGLPGLWRKWFAA